MTIRPFMIAALLSAAALSACGKTGELMQPAPLFGAQAKADYAAKQKAAAEAAARAKAAKEAEPQPAATDPTAAPLTQAPYASPIQGRSDPFGTAPAGSLPNPGTTPDR
jgi:hypothetical protein